ncbi:MAG: hypothetical protein PHY31_00435, partial [Smithellaceae bacterium]|nr:hypothetical protein [Smithellaceae bacterium]
AQWRTPAPADLGQNSTWRDKDPDRYLVVKGDFDGDGEEDIARLLIDDEHNKIGVFVALSSRGRNAAPLQVETIGNEKMIEIFGIELVSPGSYWTACGKGYWNCAKDEPAKIHLTHPAINLFSYESASTYLIWNTKRKRFVKIVISD